VDRALGALDTPWRVACALVLLASAVIVSPRPTTAQELTYFALPTPSSYPFGITVGPDGALWFAEKFGDRIGRITTSGQITEFEVPTPIAAPFMITAGPDGALWFTEELGNKIGRITTSGIITEYPLPGSGPKAPAGIALGPDGALWFTEELGAIGRITTNGVVTQFALSTANGHPYGIVAGPDGAMWFTAEQSNRIGRITMSGAVTEYPVPTPNSVPAGLAVGPDGALWFTQEHGNKIGRITTTGAISEFAIPTPTSHPTNIIAGPDGAMWFTEQQGNKIGRITMAGQITEYPTGGPLDFPSAIVVGPDGALWFTAALGNKIGRLRPAGTTPPTPTGGPQVTPTPTSGPGGNEPGGRGLAITPRADGTRLTWLSGRGHTGYAVARLTGSALSMLPAAGPLSPDATSFLDVGPPGGLSCYAVLPLGTNPQALSDVLCAAPGLRTATGSPENVTLRLNQSSMATLTWTAPLAGGHDGYAVVTLGGPALVLNGAATTTSIAISGPTCYVVAALRGGAILGHSDFVCGIPHMSNLPP
jgi:virginiamycin B lyase